MAEPVVTADKHRSETIGQLLQKAPGAIANQGSSMRDTSSPATADTPTMTISRARSDSPTWEATEDRAWERTKPVRAVPNTAKNTLRPGDAFAATPGVVLEIRNGIPDRSEIRSASGRI